MDMILSVREVTERLRQMVEQRFPYLWVRGEVTNLSRPSSGHVYFSLREGDFLLNCVWFRSQQRAQERFDPLTGEVWEGGPRPSPAQLLENGQEVVCAGRMSVYGPRGACQLVVDLAQETGQGRWHLAFEELKRKLAAEGFFDQARKRPLPINPARVALITATTGAAVRDFIRIASNRGLGSRIRIHPTPVQGDDAPPRIVAALEEANRQGWAEVAVLIRGGGSLEDLWAFNDERVARAVFSSRLPVLTGVGHEIDHSIADFVADRAAATPSHAAQLLWSERKVFAQRADDAETALRRSLDRLLAERAGRLDQACRTLSLLTPARRLIRQEERLAETMRRMRAAMTGGLERREHRREAMTAALRRVGGPDRLFLLSSRLERLTPRLRAAGREQLARASREVERYAARLPLLGQTLLLRRSHALETLSLRLKGLDPRAPLERGYALVRPADGDAGRFVRSVNDAPAGSTIVVEVRDGSLTARVLSAQSPPPAEKRPGDDKECS